MARSSCRRSAQRSNPGDHSDALRCPVGVSVLQALQTGSEEDRHETETAHAGAGRSQVARGRSAVGGGQTIPEVAKALEVSENTLHRWRANYGGMKGDDVKRLKEFGRENSTLKRIVANKESRSRRSRRSRAETAEPVAPAGRGSDARGSPWSVGEAGVARSLVSIARRSGRAAARRR